MNDSNCPCCNGRERTHWASEAGYDVVRCQTCSLLYVHPMPDPSVVDAAVKTGLQKLGGATVNVRSRRIRSKVGHYKRRLKPLLHDIISRNSPVTWVDVGCGYGEFIEALSALLPTGSRIIGVEPMAHKAAAARALGLEVVNDYLSANQFEADFISNIDVFSHIPDYRGFLSVVASNLRPGGQVIIETGNTADIGNRDQAPNELGLPDHLVFSGRDTMKRYFESSGFRIMHVTEERFDTLLQMTKNLVKLILGRPSYVRLPYTSAYRQVIYRAVKEA